MAERVYCLYRVSTNKQVDHDENNQADIPMQRKACHDFAAKMGWVIVGEEQETGVSGYKVSADDRDKLQLIKKYAEQGKFDILLVFMFDRLGRKSDETPFVVEWFTKKGVRVWSVQEGEQRFESHTDRLTNYIRFWQADGESQKTSMRTKTALGQMVEEGRFRGGNAPYGYRLEKSGILNKRKHEVYMPTSSTTTGSKTGRDKTGTTPVWEASCTTRSTRESFGAEKPMPVPLRPSRSSPQTNSTWRRN